MSHIHHMLHQRAAERRAEHAPMQQLNPRDAMPDPQNSGSVFSVVFVTASATFSGPTAGFTTLVAGAPVTAGNSQAQTSSASATSDSAATSTDSSASASSGFSSETSSSGDSAASSATDSAGPGPASSSQTTITSAAVATTLITSTANHNTPTSVGAASATTASAPSASSSQSGLSNGAKAGLAIGILALLVAVAAGVLFAYWKKKKDHDAETRLDNEKAALAASAAQNAAASPQQNSVAPRLSLRPMSKMMRFSQGNPLNMANSKPTTAAAVAAANNRQLTPSPPNQNNPFKDPQNPFTDPEKPAYNQPSVSTVPEEAAGAAAGMAVAAGAVAVAVAAAAPDDHERHAGGPNDDVVPKPLNPHGAAAGPPGPSNVYRVQMDFKPSMDDELGLQAGQLVRLLHEYDDGWALCVRLDRSQQGVVPRTCLSAKPCKPRPTGPPNGSPRAMGPGPNGRMSPAMMNTGRMSPAMTNNGRMSPAMMNNGRMSPAMARPASPASARGAPAYRTHPQPYSPAHTGSFNQAPRPLSPGPRPQPKRSMSPGPYGANGGPRPMENANQRRRSNSAGAPYAVRGGRDSPGPSRLGPGNGSQWPLHTARPV